MARDKGRSKPLYDQVKDRLLRRIVDGVYKRGEPIPSEAELAKEFGASVFTVRQAVSLLVADGMLIKRQGRRTFVSNQKTPLTFLTWLPETKQGEKILLDVIALFEKKYPSLSIEVLPTTYPTTRKDLLRRISTGNAPDVAHIVSHWTSYFASIGAFKTLEDLLAKENLENRLYDKDLGGGMYRNRLYSVAWGLCPIALIANKNVLRETGIERFGSPLTLDVFWQICKQIEQRYTHKNVYCYGLNFVGDETDFLRVYTFLQAFKGGFTNEHGEVLFNSKENAAGFRWLKNFIRECRVLFTDIYTIRERFARGEIAFISDGPWIKYALEDLTGEEFEKNFEVVLNPVESGDTSYSWNYNHALAICSQSEHKFHAAKFIDEITNDYEISNYYYTRVGHLPVNKTYLDDPLYNSTFYRAYQQQLQHAACINAQNTMFEKAMDFCIDAVKRVLFEDVDIQRELDDKEYILKILYTE
jgi:ABC-type glycerol-3-phosphate transport system substrate-binding protein